MPQFLPNFDDQVFFNIVDRDGAALRELADQDPAAHDPSRPLGTAALYAQLFLGHGGPRCAAINVAAQNGHAVAHEPAAPSTTIEQSGILISK